MPSLAPYQEYFIPIFIGNLLAIILMLLSYHFPRVLRVIWGAIFITMGVVSLITVYNNPSVFIDLIGSKPVKFYQDFIDKTMVEHPGAFILLLGVIQILFGGMIWSRKVWFILGCIGAVLFLLAILPLGLAITFPLTIFMALSIIFLMRKRRNKSIFGT
jgi:hypothetical protein